MTSRKKKDPPVKEFRSQDTLIEKSQVSHPHLDLEMEKILNDIVMGIRNCPPAHPKRKYQKSTDIESTLSRNSASAADAPLLTEKQRLMAGDAAKNSESLPKERSSLDGRARSKEASERSEEGKSTYSVKSHSSIQHMKNIGSLSK